MRNILLVIGLLLAVNIQAQESMIQKNGLGFHLLMPSFLDGEHLIQKLDSKFNEATYQEEIKRFYAEGKYGFGINYKRMVFSKKRYFGFLELALTKRSNNLSFEVPGNGSDFDFDLTMMNRMVGINYINEYLLSDKFSVNVSFGIARNSFKFDEIIEAEVERDLAKENNIKFKFAQFSASLGLRYYVVKNLSVSSNLAYSTNSKRSIEVGGFYMRYYERYWYYWMYLPPREYTVDLSSLNLNIGISLDF